MQPATVYCSQCGSGNRANATYCFSCGQAIYLGRQPEMMVGTGRIPPQQVLKQRYKIVSLVGKGGMGAVYKAEDTQFGGRLVALKEMSQSKLSSEEASEAADQFKQEAHLLANLKHPNLPSIYDYFGENGRWYLVMDFIDGTTLDTRLATVADHTLPVDEAIEIGIQLAKVLGYLHTRVVPIIFRDLKPLNIMVTPEDNIYLIDFGIARLFKTGKDKDTVAYVSPGYAAPEQFGSTQTSPQSDIYSLGATLHQLLSGNEPRSNMPLFTFKPLTSYNPDIPMALSDLVEKMVNIDLALRPASMAEIRKELERIQMQVKQPASQLPPTQYAPPPPSRLSYTTTPSLPSVQKQEQVYASSGQRLEKPALPKGKVWKTLLIGVVAGVLLYFILNSVSTDLVDVLAISVLTLITGLLIGRMVVLRRAGFFVGVIMVVSSYVIAFVVYSSYIRDFFSSTTSILYFLKYTAIGGFVGLLGSWLATIKHPYFKKP